MNWLWALFIAGQILSAGNMNYQQEMGYWEINPIYEKHPSKQQVYFTKAPGGQPDDRGIAAEEYGIRKGHCGSHGQEGETRCLNLEKHPSPG